MRILVVTELQHIKADLSGNPIKYNQNEGGVQRFNFKTITTG